MNETNRLPRRLKGGDDFAQKPAHKRKSYSSVTLSRFPVSRFVAFLVSSVCGTFDTTRS